MTVSIGIDEAGLGPIAGPVIASVVVLPDGLDLRGVTDSKKMKAEQREDAVERIWEAALFHRVVVSTAPTIDQHGPSYVWHHMIRELAEEAHALFPDDEVILDGNRLVGLNYVRPVVKADSKIRSVAAASVLAKYTQCCWMDDYHLAYPQYGFDRHHGYGTASHLERLKEYGPCPIHRKTFAPVKRAIQSRKRSQ
jgi:ribonuclease HII